MRNKLCQAGLHKFVYRKPYAVCLRCGVRIHNPFTVGAPASLKDIPERLHSDLQNVTADQHLPPKYIAAGETLVVPDGKHFFIVTAHNMDFSGDGTFESVGDGEATGIDLGG